MDLDLIGHRALVTASSAGIGTEIAHRFVREECPVMVHGRNAARAGDVAQELRRSGVEVAAVLGDLIDDDAAAQVAAAARDWGADILVNNAGPFVEHDWDAADPAGCLEAMNANVVSAVRPIRPLLGGTRARGWGRIVTLGSRAVKTPQLTMVQYSAAKAAVLNMTVSLSGHLAGTGITANMVSPGVIASSGLRRMFEARAAAEGWVGPWPEVEARIGAEYAPNPASRLGTGADVAAAVAFPSSPLAGYINGVNLLVDGGITGTV